MKFSTIVIFAFVFTVDVWALIHDIQHFRSKTDELGKPSSKKRQSITKVNIAIDVFLMVIMLWYIISGVSQQ
ncbi:hypothetical protein FC65_GL001084 [Ligilactobacillus acidipiscis DSM 15836]|jgi:hypothetical protein|uniref:Uncharacterized protein n=2 Tax=Ligilactobacillus acidipiscis TaxID=89059 RepID=A0A1K1KL93_9LACO|nr:hypothetical protein [Ligilactobacillus acidipiscis]KRM20465.1 hypothetical protein FC65_GL001084 [Ligilactobacillus acidipiscis DSM 15836]MCI1924435.1 hypothetical protein [Ligilactobacillus acidipiscis]MCI1953671.1 hypothetical protein [Ligilactobacillus acidipiscis]WEV57211.1 hypothetical protein OZX66_01315 [Ligilactobacillus acidipiscis]SFV39662.1 hypothetical protein LAC1533_0242 [Ligilactobacillus acidipiscis]